MRIMPSYIQCNDTLAAERRLDKDVRQKSYKRRSIRRWYTNRNQSDVTQQITTNLLVAFPTSVFYPFGFFVTLLPVMRVRSDDYSRVVRRSQRRPVIRNGILMGI